VGVVACAVGVVACAVGVVVILLGTVSAGFGAVVVAVGVGAAAVVVVVKVLLLPQPVTSTPPASTTTSHVDGLKITCPLDSQESTIARTTSERFGERPLPKATGDRPAGHQDARRARHEATETATRQTGLCGTVVARANRLSSTKGKR